MPTGLLAATPNARQPERKTCEVWDSRFPQSKTTVDTKLCMNGQLEKYKMVQVWSSMYKSYHPTPHMKMFISMHAGSTDKHEEMTEKKKDMKVPFSFDRSARSNSRPQNSAPQFVSMRLSLSPPSTSPHKINSHPMARCFYTKLLFFGNVNFSIHCQFNDLQCSVFSFDIVSFLLATHVALHGE